MTTDPKATGDPGGGPAGGRETIAGASSPEALESIQKDIEAMETHDYTEDAGAEGTRSQLRTIWRWSVFFVALALAVFHLWTAFTQTLPPLQQRSFHLALGLGLVFLLYPTKERRTEVHGPFYGISMAFSGLLVGYLGVGILSGTNTSMYLYLPQAVFGGLALVLLGGAGWYLWRTRASDAASRAQSAGGWTLLAGVALISLDLVTSDAAGGFFFLPILGLVLVVAALALAVALLRRPSVFPVWLWPVVTRWGLTAAGVVVLAYMSVSGIAGWNVVGPALAIW